MYLGFTATTQYLKLTIHQNNIEKHMIIIVGIMGGGIVQRLGPYSPYVHAYDGYELVNPKRKVMM